MKKCTSCREDKELNEFYNSKSYPDGKGYRCKSCDAKARKKYEEKHRERKRHSQRRARRKWAYGLTDEMFNKMVVEQNNQCGICLIPLTISGSRRPEDNRLAIDHCHDTGHVRGLLCHRCNRGLGHFLDDPNILKMAIDYLERTTNAEIH